MDYDTPRAKIKFMCTIYIIHIYVYAIKVKTQNLCELPRNKCDVVVVTTELNI